MRGARKNSEDVITWVKQPHNCCGQACVAMLAGIGIRESIHRFQRRGLTRTKDLVRVLRELGYSVPSKLVRKHPAEALPSTAILKMCFYRNGKRQASSHWILRYQGINYDPEREVFHFPVNGKITSYLPIQEGNDA